MQHKFRNIITPLFIGMLQAASLSCSNSAATTKDAATETVKPLYVTDPVPNDTDDPAIWINQLNPEQSIIIGTDKDENGGLYVFNLKGKIDSSKSVTGLKRPNNVDIEYGLLLNGKNTDIAVVTERLTHRLRVFSVPDMKSIDNGGIEVFVGEKEEGFRDLMGIALYKDSLGKIYAIVGRKNGPKDGSYLWQYLLSDSAGVIKASLVRKFGAYSGLNEIEAIAVDDEAGYVYYSDEGKGVRKYYADPAKGNEQLAIFAETGFMADHEGISIYNTGDKKGFILVSDQEANRFQIFPREGRPGNPHQHPLLRTVMVEAKSSDGSEIVSTKINNEFPRGIFIAMSNNKTFHFYTPESILGDSLLNIRAK